MIDDEYWLQYAQDSVKNSITSINDGAAKLEKMTIWFWGLYTASFTIGVSINLIEAPISILFLLGSPIILLIFTYWLCIRAQLPVNPSIVGKKTGFDPHIPFEIQLAYNETIKTKNKRFKWAINLSFFSAFLLAVALFILSFVHKKNNYTLTAAFSEKKDIIIISGIFPKNTIVKTTINSNSNIETQKTVYSNSYKVQENGILNINVPTDSTMKDLLVTAVWKEDNLDKGFVQALKK